MVELSNALPLTAPVSHHLGPALMAEWSEMLTLTGRCLSPLKACPNGRVVLGVASDCSLPLTTISLSWWPSGPRFLVRVQERKLPVTWD